MLFLLQFLDEWADFRYAEFFALLALHGFEPHRVVKCCTAEVENRHVDDYAFLPKADMEAHWENKRAAGTGHFMIVDIPTEQAIVDVCTRAVLVKNIFELWSVGRTFEENVTNTAALSPEFLAPRLGSAASWAVQVLTFGKTLTMEEKHALRTRYAFLEFQGPVQLRSPAHEYWLVVDFSSDTKSAAVASPPFPSFFGRRVGGGAMKPALVKYDLKKRPYLGPTTLDDSLAFILSNMAQVKPGDLALEPFVGTGSIAIAMEHVGALVVGTDIDPRVLRGDMYAGADTRDIPRDVRANFEAYGLPLPELVRMDAHLFHRHLQLPDQGLFQAIVTDPPYGIRAGAKKSGKRAAVEYALSAEQRVDHVPSTQNYAVEEVMLDLLDNAATALVLGGRLVYLIPTTYDFSETDLPRHPCLVLLEVCHQHLSARHGRRAVMMRKERAPSAQTRAEFTAYKAEVLSGRDAGFGSLMGKLQAALAGDAHENESVVKVMGSCGERRRQGREFRKQLREAGLAHPSKPNSLRRISKKELQRRAQMDQAAAELLAQANAQRPASPAEEL